MNLVLNASGKVVGTSYIDKNKIIIDNYSKPLLEITEEQVLKEVLDKQEIGIIKLFDNYFLTTAEIASLYETNYRTMNKKINALRDKNLIKTGIKEGRRNSSFSKTFSEERRKHIGDARRGKPATWEPYERTPEIRAKISQTLKEGYSSRRIKVNKEALSKAWADGKYDNVPMGRGIQGFFKSKKHTKNKDVYFRSLLELKFLIKIEEDDNIKEFTWEPVCISMGDNHHYTPDCLIGNTLIELKPREHLRYTGDNVDNRFEKEVQAANNYCKENNLHFKVIYDDELDFESKRFKKFLLDNPEIIEKYHIKFKKELKRD